MKTICGSLGDQAEILDLKSQEKGCKLICKYRGKLQNSNF